MLDSPPQRRLLQPLHTKSSKTRLGTRQKHHSPLQSERHGAAMLRRCIAG